MELIKSLFDRYYRSIGSIFIAIFVGILLGIILYCNIPVSYLKVPATLCVLGLAIFYIVDVIKYNKLPKNKKGDAVLVRIVAKDKEEYEDIRHKFGGQFEKFIKLNGSTINIVYIPYHLIEKNNYKDKDKIIKLLKNTNCIFLTTVSIRSEETKDNTKYVTEFNLGIIHPAYVEKIEEIFQKEVSILGMPTARLEFSKENKINVLEVTAQRISIVCKYIIARAYYLSGNMSKALSISEELHEELQTIEKKSEKNYDNIQKSICKLCYDIHIINMIYENSKTNKNIDYVEKELDEANKYIKNTYRYYEGKSVCTFLKNRDIKKTQYYIGCCKQIQDKAPWKYSKAFLKAYCNESEGVIAYQYKQAFKIPYDHVQLISFIEDIVEQEPDKNKLRFALLLLYLQIGEIETSKAILREYLEKEKLNRLEENTVSQLKKMYKDDVIKKLLEDEK